MASPSVTYTFSNSTTADATQVNQNFTDLINGVSDGTKDLSISALTCAGNVTLNGNTTIGNASSDTLTVTASLASTVNIGTTFSYDLGSTTIGLRDVFFGSADSAARTTKIRAGTVASSNTLTLPITTGTVALGANDLTAETVVAMASDLVAIYDASATAYRKMTIDNLIGGVRPMFYANRNSAQSLTSGAWAKVNLDSEIIDTNSNYDNATNYRFTPTVAGYYIFSGVVHFASSVVDTTNIAVALRKNGSAIGQAYAHVSVAKQISHSISMTIYLNGSTDYVELWALQDSGGSVNIGNNGENTFFTGMRIA